MSPRDTGRKTRITELRVRINPAERKAFEAAATATGLTLSAWLRMIALRAAADAIKPKKPPPIGV